MKKVLFIVAAGGFLAASSCAYAFDITSDPDATMNQQQKLGPNVYSQRVWNKTYNFKTGPTPTIHGITIIAIIDAGGDREHRLLHLSPLAGKVGAKRRVRGPLRESERLERPPQKSTSPRKRGEVGRLAAAN
jgi:hypothetical protein